MPKIVIALGLASVVLDFMAHRAKSAKLRTNADQLSRMTFWGFWTLLGIWIWMTVQV